MNEFDKSIAILDYLGIKYNIVAEKYITIAKVSRDKAYVLYEPGYLYLDEDEIFSLVWDLKGLFLNREENRVPWQAIDSRCKFYSPPYLMERLLPITIQRYWLETMYGIIHERN